MLTALVQTESAAAGIEDTRYGPARHEPRALLVRQLLPHPVAEAALAHHSSQHAPRAQPGRDARRHAVAAEALGAHNLRLAASFLHFSSSCPSPRCCSPSCCCGGVLRSSTPREEHPLDFLQLLTHSLHAIDARAVAFSAFLYSPMERLRVESRSRQSRIITFK